MLREGEEDVADKGKVRELRKTALVGDKRQGKVVNGHIGSIEYKKMLSIESEETYRPVVTSGASTTAT